MDIAGLSMREGSFRLIELMTAREILCMTLAGLQSIKRLDRMSNDMACAEVLGSGGWFKQGDKKCDATRGNQKAATHDYSSQWAPEALWAKGETEVGPIPLYLRQPRPALYRCAKKKRPPKKEAALAGSRSMLA